SAVKRCIADGSVGSPHVRVGHRQAPKRLRPNQPWLGRFTVGYLLGGEAPVNTTDAAGGYVYSRSAVY
ncbi:MAG: hypothetical protein ACJARU_002490, partial [Congregibacter sp.]